MLHFLRTHRLATALLGIPLAELIHHLPSADQLTTWLKLLVQLLLLITALYQLRNTAMRRSEPDSHSSSEGGE